MPIFGRMTLRTIVVDDNEIDRDLASAFVQKLDFLQLTAAFHNPLEALPVLKSGETDLLICDVDMPEISGLALVKTLASAPQVIFMTSFPDFAVQGFELEATDYLVKPFSFERFLKAVNKAMEQHTLKSLKKESDKIPAIDAEGHFYVRSEHRYVRVGFGEVLYVEALKDYVKIVTTSQTILTAVNLKVIEDQLPARDFMRIHRSYIANLNKIETIANTDIIIGGVTIPLGDSYREQLFNSVVAQRLIKR